MGLMQSGHMRRLAVHCRAPEEEHVYADRIVEQATYFGISTDAAVVEIKSLLGDGADSRAGQNIAGLPCAFLGWSIVVRCVLLSALSGPVAQRLEQGTHNPLVPGSNPGGPSLRFGAQRKKRRRAVCFECALRAPKTTAWQAS